MTSSDDSVEWTPLSFGSCESPPLVRAVRVGRMERLDLVLRDDTSQIDDADCDGMTACHVAAWMGREDMLAALLAHRPALDLTDTFGRTVLDVALRCYGRESMVLLLIAAGASLDRVDRRNLCRFASSSVAAIQLLRDHNIAINNELRGEHQSTALHEATAHKRDVAVLRTLVDECGIDLEARNSQGRTCVHIAVDRSNASALRWLISAGADVNCVDGGGSVPLSLVQNRECTVALLAAGADGRVRGSALVELAASCMDESNVHLEVAAARVDFVRDRALQVCIGLQSLRIDALQMCEILQCACGPIAPLIPFHIWWKFATAVKHFVFKKKK